MLKLNNHSWKKNTKLIFCGKKGGQNQCFRSRQKSSKSLKKNFEKNKLD